MESIHAVRHVCEAIEIVYGRLVGMQLRNQHGTPEDEEEHHRVTKHHGLRGHRFKNHPAKADPSTSPQQKTQKPL